MIAITARPTPTRAELADVHLAMGVREEADGRGLAPMTSALATIGLGDALVLVVAAGRGVRANNSVNVTLAGAWVSSGRRSRAMRDGEPPKIVVVGSFMMDLVVKAPRRPAKGETLVGSDFGIFPGGKGFNQAVAAARLGATVTMVGRLGQDIFGDMFMEALAAEGIDASFVVRDADAGTGVGTPVIDAEGDNSIVIIPRANLALTSADVERAVHVIRDADVLMLQLEVPIAASQRAAEIAHGAGTKVLINPAPAALLPPDFVRLADVITPNETETAVITGIGVTGEDGPGQAASALRSAGCKSVVLTLGGRGAWLSWELHNQLVPGYTVKVVDTTAAGDAFCAGLAVALAEGQNLHGAVSFGNGVGALATTVMGTSNSMPRRAALDEFLATAR